MELERKKYWLLLFGLIIGVSFDVFFYNKTLGISYLIFIVLVLAVLIFSFWGSLKKLNKTAWLFAVPILLLSSTFFIYSNRVLKDFKLPDCSPAGNHSQLPGLQI